MLDRFMPRIFHCDDEAGYRSLVRIVLEQADEGWEIVGEASDGAEALRLAPALAPDVLLLDIKMPGLGGIEALPLLRKALPGTRILALSTSWRSVYEEDFLARDGDGYVEKPRDAMTLPALLEAALATRDVADPLDVAEELYRSWRSDDRERSWELFAPDAEFTLLRTPGTLVGVEAMKAHLAALPEEERNGRTRAVRMVGLHDKVVIEGSADIPRGGDLEHVPVAWVLQIRDGRIRASHTFPSWQAAREAAGLTLSVTPTAEREVREDGRWRALLAERLRLPALPRPAVA